jgi:NhaP-type Na+/H+ or K+/H+ antiporter
MQVETVLIAIAAVLAFGMGAQWLAWRLRLPSILLLLLFGFVAGPGLGIVDPDEFLHEEFLVALVSVFVGLILFEGGLTLQFAELRGVVSAVRNLATIGVVVTWVLAFLAARFVLDLPWSLSFLIGGILTVTGPTVIIPLLRFVRPTARVSSVLKWEGIINDPIGAVFAVLIFEAITVESGGATQIVVVGMLKTMLLGGIVGLAGAGLLVLLLRRHWIPDYLHNPVALMLAVVSFVTANHLAHEGGLVATTIMGMALANQHVVSVKHIIEFKENIRVLLISTLFILLSARVEMDALRDEGIRSLFFLAALIVVVRPLSIFFSTLGTSLNWRERVFLGWMAPRGVVAAAVASFFALNLSEIPEAARLVPIMFIVIIGTVSVYGLTATPVARWLEVAHPNPQGVVIVGAHPWAREIASSLQSEELTVRLVDMNWAHLSAARMAGLKTFYGSALSEYTLETIELEGIGRLLSLTQNDEVNSLACLNFSEVFGRSQVFQLSFSEQANSKRNESSQIGRPLFDEDTRFSTIERAFETGGTIRRTKLTEEFDPKDFKDMHLENAIPLFLVTESKQLLIYTQDSKLEPKTGHTLISLVSNGTSAGSPAE